MLIRLMILISCVVLASCSRSIDPPDLGKLYNSSARYHGIDRNPAIVMPGILGSKLKDKTSGKVIWGAFGGDYANPNTAEEARLIALPIGEGKALQDLRDDVESVGALDRIKINLFGVPLQIAAYLDILGSLGVGGYRDQQLAMAGAVDYGDEHFTCFQFDYDWRRDNVENAKKLHEFILAKRKYVRQQYKEKLGVDAADIKFDLIAHSMGGLVVRYYMRYGAADLPADGSLPPLTWEGLKYIDRVILIGTPSAGSVQSLESLIYGQEFVPFFPKYQASILDTYPSIFQLMPRTRHKAVVSAANPDQAIDIYDVDVWQQNKWGMFRDDQKELLEVLIQDVETETERRAIAREHLNKSLLRAEQFHRALDVSATPPGGPRIKLIVGDAVETPAVLAVDQYGGTKRLSYEPGDGTVTRASALMDERAGQQWSPQLKTPVAWDDVTFLFRNHIDLTKDPVFTDNVLYYLLERPKDHS